MAGKGTATGSLLSGLMQDYGHGVVIFRHIFSGTLTARISSRQPYQTGKPRRRARRTARVSRRRQVRQRLESRLRLMNHLRCSQCVHGMQRACFSSTGPACRSIEPRRLDPCHRSQSVTSRQTPPCPSPFKAQPKVGRALNMTRTPTVKATRHQTRKQSLPFQAQSWLERLQPRSALYCQSTRRPSASDASPHLGSILSFRAPSSTRASSRAPRRTMQMTSARTKVRSCFANASAAWNRYQ